MLRLALLTLRHRWAGFVATFVGMFLCAAMMIAAGGLLETTVLNAIPAERLAAAPVVVTGDQRFGATGSFSERIRLDEGLVDTVAAVPGVAEAVPDRGFPVLPLGTTPPSGTPLATTGHDWDTAKLRPYSLSEGAAPTAGQVVLDPIAQQQSGAKVGEPVTLSIAGGVEQFEVAGIANGPGANNSATVFFTAEDASRFVTDTSKVDAIAVLPEPGTDTAALAQRITDALAGKQATVLTGDQRGHAEYPVALESDDLLLISLMLASVAFLVSLLGIAVTLTLALQNRHRELALMRAVGATPGQLRRMVLGETIAVALVASALAVAPGVLLGRWLFSRVVDAEIAPKMMAFHLGWIPTVAAVVTALVTAVGAGLVAGRRATKTRPIEALGDLAAQRTRAGWVRRGLAILCVIYSGGLVFVTFNFVSGPFVAGPATWSSILLAIALLLLGPDVSRLMVAVLGPLLRALSGFSGTLATLNARARPAQVAAVITPLILLVSVGTGSLYVNTTEQSTVGKYTEGFGANTILRSGPDGFAPTVLEEVRALPGVGKASEFLVSNGFITSPTDAWAGQQSLGGWQLKGLTADAAQEVTTTKVAQGSLADLKGDAVSLNEGHAQAMGVKVGDSITMRLGDGEEVGLRVVALHAEDEDFTSIILPARLLAEHTTSGLPNHIVAAPAAGTDAAQLTTAMEAVTAAHPGSHVVNREQLNEAFENYLDAMATINYLFLTILLGFIAISVINTLALSVGRRRREFGLQRLTGATRGQVMRMTMLEGVLVALIGIVLGSLIAPTTIVSFSLARTGSPFPVGPVWMYFAVVGAAFVLVLAATFTFAMRATKGRPLEAALPEAD
ncbi:FtsX-like permease family protein [Actinosynnema sp. NPDC049800]